MRTRRIYWMVVIALVAFGVAVSAQDTPEKEIKHIPIKSTSPASGIEMYQTYCAVCHGKDGRGEGPAASALKVPPTDLTLLAQKNGGKYPSMKVVTTIRGEEPLPAHGSKDMPIWGKLFWSLSGGHEAQVQQRVSNLNSYIESLQKK
ncbi:MAG: c-type cytochrome [Acidobacteria bacterium]|nr:c-type cytochrome [Acidobacteriota bacterium]